MGDHCHSRRASRSVQGASVKLKQLTFCGVNDLYQHPTFGARTLENIAEMQKLSIPKQSPAAPLVHCSDELEIRNERCIDDHGCGMF